MNKIFTAIIFLMMLVFHAGAQAQTVTSINPNVVVNNATQPITSISGTDFGTETALVGLWHFNGDATDSSGNHNDGAVSNINYGTGKFGQAAIFNGSSSYINIPYSVSYPITITAWEKSTTGGGAIISWQNDVQTSGPWFQFDNGWSQNGPTPFRVGWNASNIKDGNWHLLAVTVSSSGNVIEYVDGNTDKSVNPGTSGSAGQQGLIGSISHYQYFYNGLFDDIRIYNRILSSAEIQRLYSQNNLMQVQLTKSGQPTITCNSFTLTSSTTLSNGSCPVAGAAPGKWNVVVTNPDGVSGTLTNGLTITAPSNAIFFGTGF